ncbi:MAG: hypothetical protein AAF288_07265 [Planctomycetota bacterium]
MGGVLVALFVASVALGYWASRPERVARWLAAAATERSGLDVSADRVLWMSGRRVRIEGLSGRVPGLEGAWGQLSSVKAVELGLNVGAGLRGDGLVDHVELFEPQLSIVREPETGRYNVQSYTPPAGEAGPSRPAPPIRIRDGRLVLALAQPDGVTGRLTLAVDGNIDPDPDHPLGQTLDLIVRRYAEEGVPDRGPAGRGPVRLRGRIAPDGAVHLDIDRLYLDDALAVYLPPEPARFLAKAKPEGFLQGVEAVYDPNQPDPAERLRHLRVALEDVHLGPAIPAPKLASTRGRAAQIDGVVRWTPGRLALENVRGRLLGIDFTASGETADDGSDYDLTLTAGPGDVPELFTMAAGMAFEEIVRVWQLRGDARTALIDAAAVLESVRPSGRAQAGVKLTRLGPDSELTYEVKIDLLDASFAYEEFRFPVERAQGTIVVADGLLTLQDIAGVGPNGGTVSVQGEVGLGYRDGPIDVRVAAQSVPVDGVLLKALPADVRVVIDRLMHRPSARRLDRDGVVALTDTTGGAAWKPAQWLGLGAASDEDKPADPDAPPPFTLGGFVDFEGHWRLGRPGQILGTVTVRPGVEAESGGSEDGGEVSAPAMGLVYRDMPYPLTVTSGAVVVDDDGVSIVGLEAHGPTGAVARFDGRVPFNVGGADPTDAEPGVRLAGVRAPIDAVFIAALPPEAQEALRELGLRGDLTASGLYDRRRGVIQLLGQTQGAALQPRGLPWSLAQIDADLSFEWIDPEGVALADAAGGGAVVNEPTWGLSIEPKRLRVEREDLSADVRAASGRLRVGDRGLDVVDLRLEHALGAVAIDGVVGGPGQSTSLLIEAHGSDRGDLADTALAQDVLSVIEARKLQGAWQVRGALRSSRDAEGIEAEGAFTLRQGTADLGLPVKDLDADVDFAAGWSERDALPRMRFKLRGLSATVSDRRVDGLEGELDNHARPDELVVERLVGRIGGGAFSVEAARAELSDRGRFHLSAHLADARLEALSEGVPAVGGPAGDAAEASVADQTNPRRQNAAAADLISDSTRAADQGLLSARLDVEGRFDRPDDVRGRAKLGIRNARLYNQPIALGLLQSVNLVFAPSAEPFETGRATLVLQGRTAWLEEVVIESPTFALAGAGRLDVPTAELTLDLQAAPRARLRNEGGLEPLLEGLRRQVAVVQVRGPLDDPRFGVTPPGVVWLSDAWESLVRGFPSGSPAVTAPAEAKP